MAAPPKRILGALGNVPTRRNLFGPVDRDQLQMEYQAALRKDLREASVRWGFDFVQDKPLDSSNFQWEGVPGVKVPLLYRCCVLGQAEGGSPKGAGWAESPLNDKENIPHSPERCSQQDFDKLDRTPPREESSALKRKQTNITDFYQAKRRVVGKPRKSGE